MTGFHPDLQEKSLLVLVLFISNMPCSKDTITETVENPLSFDSSETML